MQIDISQFRAAFFEEAAEHAAGLEQGLLLLEKDPRDREQLGAIFRAAHSIKGTAGSLGFDEITHFTHALEGLLESLREGTVLLDRPLSTLLLRASDTLRGLLASAKAGTPADPGHQRLTEELGRALGAAQPAQAPQPAPQAGPEREWRISFAPGHDLFRQGGDPLLLVRDFKQLGTVLEIQPDLARLPPLATLDPESAFLGWTLRLRSGRSPLELREVFCFVEYGARIQIEPLEPATASPAPADERQRDQDPLSPANPDRRGTAPVEGALRVSIDKVDKLVNVVGELVIAQSMVQQALHDLSPAGIHRLREAVAELERNTREVQERVMGIRMVPIGTVFSRFHRLLRDLSGVLGKQLSLVTDGEETELDKGVVERISDPLTHLVRNAADHGLESPAERHAAGKPEQGTIRLSARHQGGAIVIEVSDDGRGLDAGRIRQKAVEQGLLLADADLPLEQLHQLIFLPGFSTAQAVSDVSGRGVGMDVVKRNVEALNGRVQIESEPGRGTTCRIRLPLTLAILDGMTLRVGQQLFVLPLVNIVESFRPLDSEVRTVLNTGEVVRLRGEVLPLLRLHRLFGIEPEHQDPRRGLVTVLDVGGAKVALLVDELLGQAQVVVKSLEQHFRRVDGVTGATILGDGRVALILDVGGFARVAAQADAAQGSPARG